MRKGEGSGRSQKSADKALAVFRMTTFQAARDENPGSSVDEHALPSQLALRCAGPVGALCTCKCLQTAALRLRELVRLPRGIRILKR